MSSPSKLFSCVEAVAILKSPVNTSTAKNHWTFTKDNRFKQQKSYCDSFYEIPDTKSKRKAGFGYGRKTNLDFNKHPEHVVPPSNTYDIKSFVQLNKSSSKGYTPQYSRNQVAPMSYIDLQQKKNPGPGRYEEFKKRTTPYWSLHNRTKSQLFPQNQSTHKIVPGPGTHQDVQSIHPLGKYHLSNRRNSKSKTFNPPHSKRFIKQTTEVPGPGIYKPKNDMSNEGKYVLSKNKSAGKRTFMMGRRGSFVQEKPRRVQTPGPGTYRMPSDFGHYDELNHSKTREMQSKTQRKRAAEC